MFYDSLAFAGMIQYLFAHCKVWWYISDSSYYVTDPDVEHIPLEELLCKVRVLDNGCYNLLNLVIGIPILESATLWLFPHKSSGGPCELSSHVIIFMGLMLDQGNPVNSSDTVYFSGNEFDKTAWSASHWRFPHLVTDQWGNACSYIQSNYAGQHAS